MRFSTPWQRIASESLTQGTSPAGGSTRLAYWARAAYWRRGKASALRTVPSVTTEGNSDLVFWNGQTERAILVSGA